MYVGSSNSDELTIRNAVFDSNTATNGGAIYTLSTELVIKDITLMNNVANFFLAYIYGSTVSLSESQQLHQGSGGGVHANKSPITFETSQAIGNSGGTCACDSLLHWYCPHEDDSLHFSNCGGAFYMADSISILTLTNDFSISENIACFAGGMLVLLGTKGRHPGWISLSLASALIWYAYKAAI